MTREWTCRHSGSGETTTATFVGDERGVTTTVTHTSAAATALNSPDRPGVVCRAKSTAVCTPRRETGTAAACAAATPSRSSSATSQMALAIVNGPVARRISSPR